MMCSHCNATTDDVKERDNGYVCCDRCHADAQRHGHEPTRYPDELWTCPDCDAEIPAEQREDHECDHPHRCRACGQPEGTGRHCEACKDLRRED